MIYSGWSTRVKSTRRGQCELESCREAEMPTLSGDVQQQQRAHSGYLAELDRFPEADTLLGKAYGGLGGTAE